jgi:hypothetical protein
MSDENETKNELKNAPEDVDEPDDRPLASGSSVPDRMRFYQSRFDCVSSDEEEGGPRNRETGRTEDGAVSHRGLLNGDDSDGDDEEGADTDGEYMSFANEYAPLGEVATAEDEEEEGFGDFQTSSIAAQLTEVSIDAIIRGTLNHMEFEPRIMGDDFLTRQQPQRSTAAAATAQAASSSSSAAASAAASIDDWKPFEGTAPADFTGQAQSSSKAAPLPPSIPPLTEGIASIFLVFLCAVTFANRLLCPLSTEKISKIKETMARFTLQPPSLSSGKLHVCSVAVNC